MKIMAIFAAHNRAALTEKLLASLEAQVIDFEVSIKVVAVDDGSTDRTPEVLRSSTLVRNVHTGNGSLYWAASMAIAEKIALDMLDKGDLEESSYILWLNDDVELFSNALRLALTLAQQKPDSVIAGTTVSKKDGKTTFGPLYRNGLHPLSFALIPTNSSEDKPVTFNGNFVLVPVRIAKFLGGINGGFSHGMADIEYGLRLTKMGFPIHALSEPVGYCENNKVVYYQRRVQAWKSFTGTKGWGNWNSMTLLLKSTSKFWLGWALASYSLWWIRRLRNRKGFHP